LNGILGNTRFGEETRRKVVKVAKRLGYTQNLIARSLRTRRTQTVGLVAGNIQNQFFAELSLKLEQNFRKHGLERVLFPGQSWNFETAVHCAFDVIPEVRSAGVDTVIGYNDVAAVGWQIAAREAGFDCPVIAFDGSPLIRARKPAMPYVDLHGDVLAKRAVELLVASIEGRDLGERQALVQPTFVSLPTH